MARRERGAAAVEFALVLPLLLTFVGGTIDFGRLFYTQIMLTNAARDGARLASMGTSYSTTQVANWTTLSASPLIVATPTVTACAGSGSQASVKVVPSAAFKWTILGFIGLPAPTPEGKASMTCP